jgi:hypothetical protein
MGSTAIIAAIDKELARLYEVRSALLKRENNTKKQALSSGGTARRRKLSAAGRARIAEAQRKRWAAARKGRTPE